jgi:hypothetical protein
VHPTFKPGLGNLVFLGTQGAAWVIAGCSVWLLGLTDVALAILIGTVVGAVFLGAALERWVEKREG